MLTTVGVFFGAVLIAALTRLDARKMGPYFAVSEFVFGFPELQAHYRVQDLKSAMIRRLGYPWFAGLLVLFFGQPMWVAATVGVMAAFLLVWPALLMGKPVEFAHRPMLVLYVSLVMTYGGLAGVGFAMGSTIGGLTGAVEFLWENAIAMALGIILTAFGVGGMRLFKSGENSSDA